MINDKEKLFETSALSGETEGARRATGVSPEKAAVARKNLSNPHDRPNPEVPEKPARRRFNAEYKLRVLQQADQCSEYGQIGALLRGEGLYSSNLNAWRKQRDKGSLQALKPSKRGRKAKQKNPLTGEVARLERENRRLKKRLDQAELIIDFQKKVAALLGGPLSQPQSEEDD